MFKNETFLKEKDIQPGLCYISKDSYVRLYLGRDKQGRFVFYQLGMIELRYVDYYHTKIAKEELQNKYLSAMFNVLMQKPIREEYLLHYKTLPKLYGTFDAVDFKTNNYYMQWCNNNCIQIQEKKPSNHDLGFVKARDLEVGRVYGNEWRNKFIYLGRGSEGSFIWCFIGNDEYLVKNPIKAVNDSIIIYSNIYPTKSNKKIKRNNQHLLKDVHINIAELSERAKYILRVMYGLNC